MWSWLQHNFKGIFLWNFKLCHISNVLRVALSCSKLHTNQSPKACCRIAVCWQSVRILIVSLHTNCHNELDGGKSEQQSVLFDSRLMTQWRDSDLSALKYRLSHTSVAWLSSSGKISPVRRKRKLAKFLSSLLIAKKDSIFIKVKDGVYFPFFDSRLSNACQNST